MQDTVAHDSGVLPVETTITHPNRKSGFNWPKRHSSFQRPINLARIAYRTNSAVDETLSLRIADARWVSRQNRPCSLDIIVDG
jgi:hypothetical protein